MNFFSAIGEFISLVFGNWIGSLIGLGVGIVISLILGTKVFKGPVLGSIVGFFLCLLLMVAGASIQYAVTPKPKVDADILNPEEVIQELDKEFEDSYKNTNGLTYPEYQDAQNDDACPTSTDFVLEMDVVDYGDFINFVYKDNNNKYRNVTFIINADKVYIDGLFDAVVYFPVEYKTALFGAVTYDHYIAFNNPKWNTIWQNFGYYPKFREQDRIGEHCWGIGELFADTYINQVSLSTNNASKYCSGYYTMPIIGYLAVNSETLKSATKFLPDYVSTYFNRFMDGEAELLGFADEMYSKVNTFYTYLFKAVQEMRYNESATIDTTDFICKVIPEAERENYPVSESYKEKYPEIEYYSVYRCNTAVKLTYKKGNETIDATDYQVDFVEEEEKSEDTAPEDTEAPTYKSLLNIKLNNANSADITEIDFVENPVVISINNVELNFNKIYTFDALAEIQSGFEMLLEKGQTYNFTIVSNALIFDKTQGSFELKYDEANLTFDYTYSNGYINYGVTLAPIGTVDISIIDLVSNPVVIILSNAENTYTFEFNDNSQLNSVISQDIKFGTYAYTITSNQLLFGTTDGYLSVNTANRQCIFNYVLNAEDSIQTKLNITNYSVANNLHLHGESSVNSAIYEYFNSMFTAEVNIYDSTGYKLIKTIVDAPIQFITLDGGAPKCVELDLNNGEEYLMQIKFTSSESSSLVLLTEVESFTYDASTGVDVEIVIG